MPYFGDEKDLYVGGSASTARRATPQEVEAYKEMTKQKEDQELDTKVVVRPAFGDLPEL